MTAILIVKAILIVTIAGCTYAAEHSLLSVCQSKLSIKKRGTH